jgi:hypothetical protein
LETVIKDVFKRVAVVLIQGHPGIFFSVVDCKVGLGYKSAGEGAAREDPAELDAEDQEEAIDMAGKVLYDLTQQRSNAVSSDGKSDLRQER